MQIFFAATAVLLGASAVLADDVQDEMKKLEGTWILESATLGGKALTKEQLLDQVQQFTFKKDQVVLPFAKDGDAKKTLTVPYRVDPKHKPKVMYVTFPEENMKDTFEVEFAVYILDGDVLKVRHVDFTKLLPKDVSDGGSVLTVYKRNK